MTLFFWLELGHVLDINILNIASVSVKTDFGGSGGFALFLSVVYPIRATAKPKFIVLLLLSRRTHTFKENNTL